MFCNVSKYRPFQYHRNKFSYRPGCDALTPKPPVDPITDQKFARLLKTHYVSSDF